MKLIDYKVLLFLINFFDGIGFAVRYPLDIFFGGNYKQKSIDKYWEENNQTNNLQQLYIHSLFCETKCHYCNCMGYVENSEEKKEKYKNQIINELNYYGKIINKSLDTLYFGGGTFSLWTYKEIEEILKTLKENFTLSKDCVWTVEMHPDSTNIDKLKLLKKYGVTNIMLGIQTTSEKLNKLNNRPFNKENLDKIVDELIKLGFKKLSFDVVYNVPFETLDELRSDLDYLVKIGKKLKAKGISGNVEINKWDISYSIPYFKEKILKQDLSNFIDKYLENNEKMVTIVDEYVDKYFLDLFETDREEIESRKQKNTAVLGIGHGSTSYIPGKIIYRTDIDINDLNNWNNIKNNEYVGYKLESIDNSIFLFLHNIRRGIDNNIFKEVISYNSRIYSYIKNLKEQFKIVGDKVIFETDTDLDIDLMTLFFFKEKDLKDRLNRLLLKRKQIGYKQDYLYENIDKLLQLYYDRNKLF